jgi:hypothetical protein
VERRGNPDARRRNGDVLSARLRFLPAWIPKTCENSISAYQKCVIEAVLQFGGFVAQYLGDGVIVYFGYPVAHEDDAEQTVHAGLEFASCKPVCHRHVVVGDLDWIGPNAGTRHRGRYTKSCNSAAGNY